MKRLVLLLSASLMLLVGCSFDDSALWKAIEQLKAEQEELREQVATQQTLLNALSKKLTIKFHFLEIFIEVIHSAFHIVVIGNKTKIN